MTKKHVTMKDIAERCGVTHVTVSLALHGNPHISKATTKKIHTVAKEMGYDPSFQVSARRLALSRHGKSITNNVLGCVFPVDSMKSEYFTAIFYGINVAAQQHDVSLLLSYYHPESSVHQHPISPVISRGEVDGLIVMQTRTDLMPMITAVRAMPEYGSRPILSLMQTLPGCTPILTDDYTGAYQATCHLLDLGHRYLVQFTVSQENENLQHRLQGIRTALCERGLTLKEHLLFFEIPYTWLTNTTILPDFTGGTLATHERIRTQNALLAFLDAHPQISAILTLNDASALRTWQTLKNAGHQVPAEYSIVGFDDTHGHAVDTSNPQLTTVRLPLFDVGYQAAMRLITPPTDLHDTLSITLPTELMVRESTGPTAR